MTYNKIYKIRYSEGQYEDYYTWDDENFFLTKEAAINYLYLNGYHYKGLPDDETDILENSSSDPYNSRYATIKELSLYDGATYEPPVYSYPQYKDLPITDKTLIHQDYLLTLSMQEGNNGIALEETKLFANKDSILLEDLVKLIKVINKHQEETSLPEDVEIVYLIDLHSHTWRVLAKPLVKNPYALSSKGLGVGHNLKYDNGFFNENVYNVVVLKAISYSNQGLDA